MHSIVIPQDSKWKLHPNTTDEIYWWYILLYIVSGWHILATVLFVQTDCVNTNSLDLFRHRTRSISASAAEKVLLYQMYGAGGSIATIPGTAPSIWDVVPSNIQ